MTVIQTIPSNDDVPPGRPPRRFRTALLVAAALVGGALGGAGSLALAAGPWQGGWMHGHRLEHMQRMVRGALDSVGATTVQEDKIHDIIATNFADGGQMRDEHRAMRQQMIDLLRAPTIDRDAVEKLRSQQVADFDAHSKKTVGAILDAADQLTPEQRTQLADRMAFMMERRHGMDGHGWRGRDGMGGPDHPPMDRGPQDDGPGRDGGPDHDGGPDKG